MTQSLRILLVEDSPEDAELILLELRRAGFNVASERVEDRDGMAAALAGKEWDLVLSDHALPQFSSLAALELVQQQKSDLPLILVSGKIGEEAAVAVMRAGARDYITKDHLARLGPAIERELQAVVNRRQLRQWEELRLQLAAIVESSDDAIISTTLRGLITSWNPGAERLFGYAAEEVLGKPIVILLPMEKSDTQMVVMNRIKQGQRVSHYETVRVRKDGRPMHVSLSASPILDASRTIVGVSLIARDISERKRAEDEIRLLQTITLAVSETQDLTSALVVVLRKVCEATGWILGQAWIPRRDGMVLECSPAWYSSVGGLGKFRALSEKTTFPPGRGLPGRVWTNKQPAWIENVTQDTNFPRAPIASEVGLKAGMGIPVLAGEKVVAVIEFFVLESKPEHEPLIRLVSAVATQLGTVIQRKQAEAEREKLLRELQEALATIKTLHGFLPICANCKKIRDDQGYWNQIEAYIAQHSDAQFTHGICPDCARKLYPGIYKEEKS